MVDLGDLGETNFKLLSEKAGFFVNKAYKDTTGWDYILELPFESGTTASEVHKPAATCKVQVKATKKKKKRLAVKLSNLRRLATDTMPAFYVFIEFDNKDEPENVYVVHLDSTLITKVLERIYKLNSEGFDANNLHKKKMEIRYGEESRLAIVSGVCLKEYLLKCIGNNVLDYIDKKKKHLESTGFETGRRKFTFNLKKGSDVSELINMTLGVEGSVEVENATFYEERFGVKDKNSFVKGPGKLSIFPVSADSEGVILIRGNKLSHGASFPVKLFSTVFNALANESDRSVRIANEFFSIKIFPYSNKMVISFNINYNRPYSLGQLKDFFYALDIILSPGRDFILDIAIDGRPKVRQNLKGVSCDFDYKRDMLLVEAARELCQYFDVVNNITASVSDLDRFENNIQDFNRLLKSGTYVFRASFKSLEIGVDNAEIAISIFSMGAWVGDHYLGGLFSLKGKLTNIEDNEYKIEGGEVKLESPIILEKTHDVTKEDLHEEMMRVAEKYEKDYIVFISES
ncbi:MULTISPECIES: hypothetical protein [Halomonadaceae]|uniref:hypothetical protein n=1 Tax=Halomonadaceae TaxID=28256 RepID=UPI001599E838|nr:MULTISPECIES: hypothetical protein [Halomonas]QJQ96273.1 hypothetical protein HIO72_14025 [Halomonas sp. PA5]